jgi:hypothetical protein
MLGSFKMVSRSWKLAFVATWLVACGSATSFDLGEIAAQPGASESLGGSSATQGGAGGVAGMGGVVGAAGKAAAGTSGASSAGAGGSMTNAGAAGAGVGGGGAGAAATGGSTAGAGGVSGVSGSGGSAGAPPLTCGACEKSSCTSQVVACASDAICFSCLTQPSEPCTFNVAFVGVTDCVCSGACASECPNLCQAWPPDTCGGAMDSPWPMRRRCSTKAGLALAKLPDQLTIHWKTTLDPTSNVVIGGDGFLYVALEQSIARIAPDGTLVTKHFFDAPAQAGGNIGLGPTGDLFALRHVGNDGDKKLVIAVMDPVTGSAKWSWSAVDQGNGEEELVFAPSGTTYLSAPLTAFAPDGSTLFATELRPGPLAIEPNGTIVAAVSGATQLAGISANDGVVVWTNALTPFVGNPSVGPDGLARVTFGEDGLAMFDSTGHQVWKLDESGLGANYDLSVGADGTTYDLPGGGIAQVSPSGAVSYGTVGTEFQLSAVDPTGRVVIANGSAVVLVDASGGVLSTVLIAAVTDLAVGGDGTVYAVAADGLYALGP